MANDSRQRKKEERRRKRQAKKVRQQVAREVRLQPVTCPNCGERYGSADDPEVVHRAGPCDCTPKILKAMNDFLDARNEAYEEATDGKIACKTCGVMHSDPEQSTHFFEGRLVWDGCDHCLEAQAAKFEAIREEYRERWFGPRLKPVVSHVMPSKYVPPTVEPSSIYAGSFVRPGGGS